MKKFISTRIILIKVKSGKYRFPFLHDDNVYPHLFEYFTEFQKTPNKIK